MLQYGITACRLQQHMHHTTLTYTILYSIFLCWSFQIIQVKEFNVFISKVKEKKETGHKKKKKIMQKCQSNSEDIDRNVLNIELLMKIYNTSILDCWLMKQAFQNE